MEEQASLQSRLFSGLSFVVGGWLLISPFLLSYTYDAAVWNQALFGALILILSAIRYINQEAEWASWFTGLAGLWLIIAPFLLAYSKDISYVNEALSGIIVSILAFWNMGAYSQHYHRPI